MIMKKKIISDIRLFKSEAKNEHGGYMTVSFGDKKLNAVVQRIVMKLRENEFSFGAFDHLYINFTTCDMDGAMDLSDKVDRYHPWYRYCSVHVEQDLYSRLGSSEAWEDIVLWIQNVLVTFFASVDFDEESIRSCIWEAMDQGEDMLMKFREKVTTKRRAVVCLRFLDTCRYAPLLRVYDLEGRLLFETDLPETIALDYLGEIQVSAKRVSIKPRKNAFTGKMVPLVFDYNPG